MEGLKGGRPQQPAGQSKSKQESGKDAANESKDEAQDERWQRAGIAMMGTSNAKPVGSYP